LAELTAGADTDRQATARASAFFAALGLTVEHVGDAPGLVMGRIAAQLVNEARFAVAEGVGTAHDIDAGTTLGLNYPHGSSALGALLGDDYVRAVLDGLYDERREERYRLAPALRT
jgi:3-hydroxybutyryl-CoA dehydrogenase